MAIIYYKFLTPLNLQTLPSEAELGRLVIFAKRSEIPPGRRIKITPEGYRDNYFLRTYSNPKSKREETIGEVIIKRQGGKKITAFSVSPERQSFTKIEEEGESATFKIGPGSRSYLILRPNVLDGGSGYRIDGVVAFEES